MRGVFKIGMKNISLKVFVDEIVISNVNNTLNDLHIQAAN